MKKTIALRLASASLMCACLASLSGCVVAPVDPGYHGPVVRTGIYVEPYYASPGPGWNWERHPTNGWGWRHPDHGWHKGWR